MLTLAFSGFPASILALKRDLERAFPDLYPEEPGSRWPKVTLAARHQDRLLTPDHVDVLYRLCRPWNARLEQEAIAPLPVEVLSVVAYDCRSLERRRQTYRFPLEGGVPDPGDVPPPEHRRYVERVLAQFTPEHLERYLPALLTETCDASHYRRTRPGTTLVCDLPAGSLPFLDAFLDDVEHHLPGLYERFAPESRHVTIRHLAPLRL